MEAVLNDYCSGIDGRKAGHVTDEGRSPDPCSLKMQDAESLMLIRQGVPGCRVSALRLSIAASAVHLQPNQTATYSEGFCTCIGFNVAARRGEVRHC